MERDRIARLSEGQRECLRMVYRHMETSEIARALGISPDGVAQRIKAAMRILGVNRRREAAALLALAEGGGLTEGEEHHSLLYLPSADFALAAFREDRSSDLSTKTVRSPDGELVELKVVNSDSSSLPRDLLVAFRSNVRNILRSRRRNRGESDDTPKA